MPLNQGQTLTFQKSYFICLNESPLKILKNAFYFFLKALFFLKIFNFFPDFFGHVTKWLVNFKVNFKICDVTYLEKQVITIHILPNMSRNKCHRTMKFGQLIEYNMNIFLQILRRK